MAVRSLSMRERLQQIVDGIDFERAQGILVVGRGENDARKRNIRMVGQRIDYIESVHARHANVEEQQLRVCWLSQVRWSQGLLPTRRRFQCRGRREAIGATSASPVLHRLLPLRESSGTVPCEAFGRVCRELQGKRDGNLHSIYIQLAHCERAVVTVVQTEAIFHIGQAHAVSARARSIRFFIHAGFQANAIVRNEGF